MKDILEAEPSIKTDALLLFTIMFLNASAGTANINTKINHLTRLRTRLACIKGTQVCYFDMHIYDKQEKGQLESEKLSRVHIYSNAAPMPIT